MRLPVRRGAASASAHAARLQGRGLREESSSQVFRPQWIPTSCSPSPISDTLFVSMGKKLQWVLGSGGPLGSCVRWLQWGFQNYQYYAHILRIQLKVSNSLNMLQHDFDDSGLLLSSDR